MRLVFTLPVVMLLLSACDMEGKHSNSNKFMGLDNCEDGGTWVKVHYGDSSLKVMPKISVKKGSGIEFRLKPSKKKSDLVDYETVEVTIKGKATRDGKNDWITAAGTAKDNGALTLCASADVGDYEYLVEVEGVGTLDPRVKVDPQ
jgi:hypothetical protein